MARGQIPPFARTVLSREASAWLQLVLKILERVGSPWYLLPRSVCIGLLTDGCEGTRDEEGGAVKRRPGGRGAGHQRATRGVAEERATRGVAEERGYARLRARVLGEDDLEALAIDVRVDLGGGDVRVAEHRLDGA